MLCIRHQTTYFKMKMSLLFIIFSTLHLDAIATPYAISTEPEKIVSITQVLYEMEYYETQVGLWEKEISEDSDNANAWMNYYLACRVVNTLNKDQNPYDLSAIYDDIKTQVADTYEFHYLTYLNGRGDTSLFFHLEKAFALDPSRTEVLSHMVTYYAIKGDTDQMTKHNKLWLESGEISSGILNWNYNALIGLEKNAILLTYGDNDTYPAWMLQQAQEVRSDVKVINIHLLRNREYIDRVFEECDVPLYPSEEEEKMVWESDLLPVVDHIFYHSGRPVYINVTLPKMIRDNYKDVLYTVGLAFKYSVPSFDNISVVKDNYENKFLKDYLKLGFSYDKSVTVLNSLNVNYLPAFISLYNHYIKSDDKAKAKGLREVIENISIASGKEDEVSAILEKPIIRNRAIDSHFDIKKVDKNMIALSSTLYAASTETTNEFYDKFLLDLLKEKEFDLLELCKSDKVDWMSLLPEKMKHLSQQQAYSNGDPDSAIAPVTNISYAAAEAYCEWLTIVYNSYPKKKRHQEVLFRLPTEEEWEYAATGMHELPKNRPDYPWGGYYYQNAKGCYLANFYSTDEPPCEDCKVNFPDVDGGFFVVNATAYFPNNFGLYNCSGNVAEMVSGGEVAKGGSWEDPPSECKISSRKEVSGPSPAIGFRVLMEVMR